MQMDRVHAHAFLRVGLPMFRKLRRRISYTQVYLDRKRKIASTLTFLGGCFAATNI